MGITRIELTDEDIGIMSDDLGYTIIYDKHLTHKEQAEQLKKQILEEHEFRNSMNGAMQNQDSVLVSKSELKELKDKAKIHDELKCVQQREKLEQQVINLQAEKNFISIELENSQEQVKQLKEKVHRFADEWNQEHIENQKNKQIVERIEKKKTELVLQYKSTNDINKKNTIADQLLILKEILGSEG